MIEILKNKLVIALFAFIMFLAYYDSAYLDNEDIIDEGDLLIINTYYDLEKEQYTIIID